MTPQQVLKQYWGYDDFRHGQLTIIDSILHGKDTLAIMPTGGGKSICFQVPALILPGLTLVVSPLISLMKDQVDALTKRGVAAAYLSSAQTPQQQSAVYSDLRANTLRLLYLSPERLQSRRFQVAVRPLGISLIVIDEAHCISEWGHDFRPEFRQVSDFISQRKIRPTVAAFTATATPETQRDIVQSLQLRQPFIQLSSFARTNLGLQVIHCPTQFVQQMILLKLLLKHRFQSGIIYVSSRQTAENLCKVSKGLLPFLSVEAYHAGLSAEERTAIQERFIQNKTELVFATNAFGMGIDKANIRFVIHFHIPGSLEHYYQEVGRAGRDRDPSKTYLLYNENNLSIHLGMLNQNKDLSDQQRKRQLFKLHSMRIFAKTSQCRSQFILQYFGEQNELACEQCDRCLAKAEASKSTVIEPSFEIAMLLKLEEFRTTLARSLNLSPTSIATDKVLYQLALVRPTTQRHASQLAGVGQGWIKQWWDRFGPLLS